ncbi:MAG: MFS transporter [Peptostreptococcaceae bacterium]|nr:MFS transporter [Peptostreptococcaceae bacterium]
MKREIKKTLNNAEQKKVYSVLIGAVFGIIVIVLGFTAVLNILSYKQNYEDSLIRSYSLAGKEAVKKIEYAVKYGKPLDRFFGMQDLLSEIKEYLPEIENCFVILPDGKMAYDLQGSVSNKALGEEMLKRIEKASIDSTKDYVSISEKGMQHIFISIHTQSGELAGKLDIVFDTSIVEYKINTYIKRLVIYLSILSLISIVLIVFLYNFFIKNGNVNGIDRKVLMRIILCVLAAAQIIFGYINYSMFESGYMNITKETAAMASKIIQRNVELVVDKGVPYGSMYNLEDYLKKTSDIIPEIDSISINDSNNNSLYSTIDNYNFQATKYSDEYLLSVPLKQDAQGVEGSVKVLMSGSNISSNLRDVLLDAVTIIVVSFFFMIEITFLVLALIWKSFGSVKPAEVKQISAHGLIRPLAFMVYGVVFMTASFVPVIMSLIYKPFLGLPKDIVLGLPISVEMLCGLIATVAAGYAIDRKGWKGSFVFGIAFFMLGTLLSGLATNPFFFTVARGLSGAGFGLLVMAMRSLVISTDRKTGIADMTAGAIAGVNCGVVTGAMLADRVGFESVFYISAALAVLALIFAVKKIGNSGVRDKTKIETKSSFMKFLLNKQILSFLILILIPVSICAMFLNYYFPLFANDIGMSSSNVGRAFMLNGLCIVYLGPFLSRFFENKLGNKKTLIIAVSLTAISILIFAVFGSMTAAFAALLLMGVSDSFGISAQIGVFMNSKGALELGESKAIAYYSIVGKLGQMLGPITFGAVAFLGIGKGMGLIGMAVLAALVLYIIIMREKITSEI